MDRLIIALAAAAALAGCTAAGGGVSDAGGPRVGDETDGGGEAPGEDAAAGDDLGLTPDEGPMEADASLGADLGAAPIDDAALPGTDASTPPVDATADAAPVVEGDAGPAPAPSSCKDGVTLNETFPVDPAGPFGQLYVHASFDGDGVWLAYSRPTPDADFDVWLARVDCAGQVTDRQQVTDDVPPNEIDPSIAVGPESVLVVWTADAPDDQPSNLSIRQRLYDRQARPLGPSRRLDLTTPNGATFVGNAWRTHAIAHEDGFWVTGTRGAEGAGAFQVFVQHLDRAGAPDGPTIDVAPAPDTTQWDPVVELSDQGDLWVAWIDGFGTGLARLARRPAGAATFEPAVELAPGTAGAPTIAADGAVYAAAYREAAPGIDIVLRAVDGGATVVLGAANQRDLLPTLAPGAIAWQRQQAGVQYSLWAQRLAPGPAPAGAAVQIPTGDPAGPANPGLVRVGERAWLVLWSEGPRSPNFKLFGRFVSL